MGKTKYYWLNRQNTVAKREDSIDYIYSNNCWVHDNTSYVADRIAGYDGEDIGVTWVLSQIDEITEYELNQFIENGIIPRIYDEHGYEIPISKRR